MKLLAAGKGLCDTFSENTLPENQSFRSILNPVQTVNFVTGETAFLSL